MRFLSLISAMTLTACSTNCAELERAPAMLSSIATVNDHEITDHWIVRRDLGKSCPSSTADWTISPLFDNSNGLPLFLARYCVVSSNTGSTQPPSSAYGESSRDYVAVVGMEAAPDGKIIANTLEQIDPFPDYTTRPSNRSFLVIFDTSPTGFPAHAQAGGDTHGQKLSALATAAVCDDDDDCVAIPVTREALSYKTDGGSASRDSGSGSVGSLGDLARSIHDQMLMWEESYSDHPQVLNLSLGWNPAFGGSEGTAGDMSPPVSAVYDALRYASCQGALVVAAAGNRDLPTTETDAVGPVYPAAWETHDAPDAETCEAYLGKHWVGVDPIDGEAYAPLLYAAGAIDTTGETLATQRPDSQPMHVAAGAHLTAYNAYLDETLDPISGTSAATVLVSSAAAVVRSHAPDASAHTIMRLLRESATTTVQDNADVCLGTKCDASSVIQVCEALRHACDTEASCPDAYSTVDCISGVSVITPAELDVDATVITGENEATCGDSEPVHYDNENTDTLCPTSDFPGAASLPVTWPSPHDAECPWCPAYVHGDDLLAELMTLSDMSRLENATITLHYGPDMVHYAVGAGLTGNTNVIQLSGIDSQDLTGVSLAYSLVDEPVFIVEPLYLINP